MATQSFINYINQLGILYKEISSHQFPGKRINYLLLPFGGIVTLAAIDREWINLDPTWSRSYVVSRATVQWNTYSEIIIHLADNGNLSEAQSIESFFRSKLHHHLEFRYPNSPYLINQMVRERTLGLLTVTSFIYDIHQIVSSWVRDPRHITTTGDRQLLRERNMSRFITGYSIWHRSIPEDWESLESETNIPNENTTPINETQETFAAENVRNDTRHNRTERLDRDLLLLAHTRFSEIRDEYYHLQNSFNYTQESAGPYLIFSVRPGGFHDSLNRTQKEAIKRLVFNALSDEAHRVFGQLRAIHRQVSTSYVGSDRMKLLNNLAYIFPFFSNVAPYIPQDPDRPVVKFRPNSLPWQNNSHTRFNMRLIQNRNNEAQRRALDSASVSFRELKLIVYGKFPVIFVLQKKLNLGQIATILELRRSNPEEAERQLETILRNYVFRPLRNSLALIRQKLNSIWRPNSIAEIGDLKSISFVTQSALKNLLQPVLGENYSNSPLYEYCLYFIEDREPFWTNENRLTAFSLGIGITIGTVFPTTILAILVEGIIALGIDLLLLIENNQRNELNSFAVIDQQLAIAEVFDLREQSIFILFGHVIGFGISTRLARNANISRSNPNVLQNAIPDVPIARLTNRRIEIELYDEIIRRISPLFGSQNLTDLITRLFQSSSRRGKLRELFGLVSDNVLTTLRQLDGVERLAYLNNRAHSIKGYVQEALRTEMPWFDLVRRAAFAKVARVNIAIADSGLELSEPIFTHLVSGNGRQLTDGILYSTFQMEDGRTGIVILSIFESKSSYNWTDWVDHNLDGLTQLTKDLSRFIDIEEAITINGQNYTILEDLFLIRQLDSIGPRNFEPVQFILSIPSEEYHLVNTRNLLTRVRTVLRNDLRTWYDDALEEDGVEIFDWIQDVAQIPTLFENPLSNDVAYEVAYALLEYLE
ncbi:hypothetical protein [Cellulophaga sp. Hel_I_12]|uniref:hypothetical protein n=1 Tax=Cellulophaga sp. Hel_I_12 TaxID=1249972 RepID=UPI00064558B1|nr:hypothetical protein [Cellulophaga sp. Hel_I_12]